MHIRQASDSDLEVMVGLAVESQASPQRHIGYLGPTGDSIRTDILGVEQWSERTAVVVDAADEVAGWLLGEKDDHMDRVWWWGPFVRDDVPEDQADALYLLASNLVGASQEEMAPDDRNRGVAALAVRNGFCAGEASAVLSYVGEGFGGPAMTVVLDEADRSEVAALHDELFPGTHTTGQALVDSDDPRLVVIADGRVVAYVAAEIHSDRTGYIDFLGVHPSWRRRGLGRRLVVDATNLLLEHEVDSVHLTVREHNAAARALYTELGFIHERLIRPYRKGFSLD